MRDKLISLILEAQGLKGIENLGGYWGDIIRKELEDLYDEAGKIADALLASGLLKEE